MGIITPRTFRGTRDFLPSELIARNHIRSVIEEAYGRYGFQPLETPAIEYLDILTGKSEENDKLIYEIKRARGDEEDTEETAIALRYDLTVPLARVVAQYHELPRPFKRYQIQPVWRADRPQPRQGRFREFVQCDADIVGTSSLLADAEIVALTHEILNALGFEKFNIRVSSRKFLMGLALFLTGDENKFFPFCRAIDKFDKVGWEGVSKEFAALGVDSGQTVAFLDKIIDDFKSCKFDNVRTIFGAESKVSEGINEIESVYLQSLELGVNRVSLLCDPLLARGLDYYTGPIFETVLPDYPHIGSLTGGGRYDGLVSTFSKQHVPATGTTLGLDRIQTALTQLGKFKSVPSATQVLVTRFDEAGLRENLKIASELRHAGLNVEIWYDDDRMKKQFSYADQQRIPFALVCGPDERGKGLVSVKNLMTSEQTQVMRLDLVKTLKGLLSEI